MSRQCQQQLHGPSQEKVFKNKLERLDLEISQTLDQTLSSCPKWYVPPHGQEGADVRQLGMESTWYEFCRRFASACEPVEEHFARDRRAADAATTQYLHRLQEFRPRKLMEMIEREDQSICKCTSCCCSCCCSCGCDECMSKDRVRERMHMLAKRSYASRNHHCQPKQQQFQGGKETVAGSEQSSCCNSFWCSQCDKTLKQHEKVEQRRRQHSSRAAPKQHSNRFKNEQNCSMDMDMEIALPPGDYDVVFTDKESGSKHSYRLFMSPGQNANLEFH
eukprot:m.18299 g.18299  ORF g.18299 m.18299 type:complete len:276 (-) comp8286_c0_seq1:30-857(-)